MSYLCINKPALDMHMCVLEKNLRLNNMLIQCLRRAFCLVPSTVEQS
jgi:hypothetical protein